MSIPERHTGPHYSRFLADLVKHKGARTYLEVGVFTGRNMHHIQVKEAFGVDPGFKLSFDVTAWKESCHLYKMTSDAFFKHHKLPPIDVAFLDGMHLFEYLLRDFYNAEACCDANAVIALHDCLPMSEAMITRDNHGGAWTGDVWKVVSILREYRPDLRILLLDCAPTGLVCVTNLDPTSTVLRNLYLDIVSEFSKTPNNREALEEYYSANPVMSSASVATLGALSLHFRV